MDRQDQFTGRQMIENLKLALRKRGFKQGAIGRRIGRHQSSISRLFAAGGKGALDLMVKIINAYGISWNEITSEDGLRNWNPRQDDARIYIQQAEHHLSTTPVLEGIFSELHMMIATEKVQRWKYMAQEEMLRGEKNKENILQAWEAIFAGARRRYQADTIRMTHFMLPIDWESFCEAKGLYRLCQRADVLECIDRLREFENKRFLRIKIINPKMLAQSPKLLSYVNSYQSHLILGDRLAVDVEKDHCLTCTDEQQSVQDKARLIDALSAITQPCDLAAYEKWIRGGTNPKEKPQLQG